jgi:small subunit ribosomal protein S7
MIDMAEEMKIFGAWDVASVKVNDAGLERYINLKPAMLPKSGGRNATQPFHRAKMSIVERLITKLMVPGHHGKKHVMTSGRATGKFYVNYGIVRDAFEKIEKQTKKNPVEVLVRAVENSALREEISAYQIGGIVVRRAVTTSPQRRVDLALRSIAQASYKKSFGKRDTMATALANELIAGAANDASKSEAVKERERVERESESSR